VDGRLLRVLGLEHALGAQARPLLERTVMADLFYSLGWNVPGAITLGNYPAVLQDLPTKQGRIDLATVEILRDRERGVPRYNQFRELLHLPRVPSFEALNRAWSAKLREVYGTIDRVDLMVGLLAEAPPPGFAFSDTTFRIFLLMNSRRLKSDRFFTTDYTPAVYTRTGLDWIDANDFRSVLLRHLPELGPVLRRRPSPFTPWR
jgi:hypothetical protein